MSAAENQQQDHHVRIIRIEDKLDNLIAVQQQANVVMSDQLRQHDRDIDELKDAVTEIKTEARVTRRFYAVISTVMGLVVSIYGVFRR